MEEKRDKGIINKLRDLKTFVSIPNEDRISQIMDEIIGLERRMKLVRLNEVAKIIKMPEDDAKEVLKLLEDMGLIERTIKITSFARDLQELPGDEPNEIRQKVEERMEDLLRKEEILQESALKDRAKNEITKAREQLDMIVKAYESEDYERALDLSQVAYKYLSDALESIARSLPF